MFSKSANASGQQKEQTDTKRQRSAKREIERRSFEFLIFLTCLHIRRKRERAHAEPERVPQKQRTAQKGNLGDA